MKSDQNIFVKLFYAECEQKSVRFNMIIIPTRILAIIILWEFHEKGMHYLLIVLSIFTQKLKLNEVYD